MEAIEVAPAGEREARACLALLPQTWRYPTELLIARREGRFAGAAGLYWQSWSTPAGFPAAIHVIPPERRRGVGRALLAAAADLAAPETDGLWSFEPAAADSEAAAFVRACGGVRGPGQRHFQARVQALFQQVEPMARRLRERGHVPGDARVVPLAAAPLDEVAWMLSRELGGEPGRNVHNLTIRARQASQGEMSLVALAGADVAAVLLCRLQRGVVIVDARVVAPALRNRWANLILLEAILMRASADGISEFRFHCDDNNRDTLSLARRCAATETEEKALYYYAVSAA